MQHVGDGKTTIESLGRKESIGGFQDALTAGFAHPQGSQSPTMLKTAWIETKIGRMVAIADDAGLYLLQFADRPGLDREIEKLRINTNSAIISGITNPIKSIADELDSYFHGELKQFATPIHLFGSNFQKLVWKELMRVPYGQTRTYASQAEAMGARKSFRAVANANGANQLALIIPCHRVIKSSGEVGGYSSGSMRKQWLIEHEKRHV